jgi:hypothetical protein
MIFIYLLNRFSLDLGVPVVSMDQILRNVQEQAGKNEEFSHSFYMKVKAMIDNEDVDQLVQERVHLKLLRLCAHA